MKIYEIGTGYTPIPAQISAATEIVVENLTKAMKRQGLDVTVVDIRAKSRPKTDLPILEVPVAQILTGTDVSLGLCHKAKRIAYSLSLARVLRKILDHTGQRVVLHFHNQYNLFFFLKLTPTRLRRRCIIAYTNHSGIWRQEWKSIAKTVQTRYFQEAFCMRHADLVFVLNEETKQNIMTHLGVPEGRIEMIPNGVDTRVYRPLPFSEKKAAKEAFSLTEAHILLQVGSVCENKGQLRVVQALLPLLKHRKDLVYAYAGGIVEEDYQQQLLDFAKSRGIADQVRYLGMITPGEKLNRLYNTTSATILASRYEAFGLVAIESLAAGVPVLLEETGPVRFGEGCLLYRRETLAETLDALLTNNPGQYGPAARDNALAHYHWDTVAESYLRAFTDRMVNHG